MYLMINAFKNLRNIYAHKSPRLKLISLAGHHLSKKKKILGPENTKTQRIQNYKVLLLSVLNMLIFSK